MKPLTLEETKLKEEMKERCLAKGQYKDENAKAKFNMLCHLEDFEVQYWELEQQNQKYKEVIDKIQKHCEIEINASKHYLENHSSQKELCHKVAHQRILDILKEVE